MLDNVKLFFKSLFSNNSYLEKHITESSIVTPSFSKKFPETWGMLALFINLVIIGNKVLKRSLL